MKKVLFLAALVLGIASCQKDFTAENESRGEVSVQLSVAAPELIGATRTDGDAQKFLDSAYGAIDYLDGAPAGDNRWDWDNVDLRYSMEVYDEADLTTPIKDRMVIIKDKYEPVTFELRLIPGREYRFVVFADFVPNGTAASPVEYNNQADLGLRHYIDGNLTKISIKQDAINDEIADAYFKAFTYTPSSSSSNKADDVVLKRPYGKVRVVATDLADLNLNVEPKYVEITYINSVVPTTFNAVEGTVGTETSNKTFGYELVDNIRTNRDSHVYNAGYDAMVEKNVYGEDRASHLTLFTDYILATDTHSPISFQMTVYDDAAHQNPIKTVQFNTNIPVQRNHLTTIIGNVMTANTEFTVTIDDTFEGQYTQTEEDSFASALKDAENSVEATIELTEDIEWVTGAVIGSTPWISETAETEVLTVEANGHKIVATGKGVGAIRMANGGKLIINNATIVDKSVSYAENSWEYGYLEFEGELEFNNCVFVNAVQFDDANVTFNECSFNSNDDNQYAAWICGDKAYFNACAFEGPRAIKVHEDYGSEVEEVVVDGCTFTNIYKKPGIALGTLNADTKVVIKNSTFNNCQAGDQGLYIYETDTDVTTFDFTEENNTVIYKPENKAALQNILKAAAAAGETNVVIDAQGANINLDYGLSTTTVPAGTTVTIRNANVEGKSKNNYVNGTVIFEDCTFNNASGAYSIHFGGGTGNLIFKNCKLYGWNSFAGTLNSVSFENCTLDGNGIYALIRSYANLTLTNCAINTSNANHNDSWPEGIEIIAPATLTENNVTYVVENQTALADVLAAGKTNVTLTAGNYELYGLNFAANNVTLKGADKANVVLNLEKSIYLQNKSVTLENLTYNLNAGKGYTEQAFAFVHHATAFNLKNCNVNRLRLNVYEANIEDCTFTLNTSSGFDGYCIYYYGNDNSTVNVKNSTFATAGKGICIYSEHAKAYNLNVDKCSFTSSDSATDKAAIQMHTELGIFGNVKITDTTATGFADINGGLWNELNNNTKVATDKFDIWVDGTQVH